ncbi:HTH-type transcriptional activator IlvY [Glaciecola sp. XM2]|jgi:LysR family positive regulator for ilvC|uniref:HTH-type transcriptional activator IlvY n=1 Tax=Glaciecola sp. XM2 TaxID=1914931 RepID=UPI001BDE7ADD|nr:HTH-type transcriptional activator IlvY [Glaciecola sp. XM2]MBT1451466.1 HTH-type transcriptional activator IlvY [Glaciecola sp. XM2]
MDIKSLRLFQHLANSLHFSKSAAAMYVSPPTLTRVIARLEQECKSTLFVRNNRSVALTPAGHTLLEFANETLAQFAKMQNTMQTQQDALSGELSLYCSVTASQSYMPNILDRLHQQYPLVEIKLDTGDHSLAIDKVMSRAADIALATHVPDFPSHVSFAKLDTVPLVLIVPKTLNINAWEELNWADVNVVMPTGGPSKRIVHHWFAEHNIRPHVYAQVTGNEAIVSMVALGLGVGFVPKIVLENSVVKSKVKALKVASIEPYQLGVCYLTERENEPLIKSLSQLLVS